MNLEDVMPSETSQSQNENYCMSPSTRGCLEQSNSERRKVEWRSPGTTGRREWELVLNEGSFNCEE